MGIFSNTLGGGRKNKPKTGGIFANTLSRRQQPAQQPYHTSVDSRGNSMGFSDERDTSGRPFFAYRNPGDTATTTDRTRVATRFDPRRPASQTRDSFYNPRDTRIGDSDKKTQIDHKIALALSGSNNPANLRTVLNAQNNDSDIIRDLQGNVIAGRKSLFQAQSDLAIEKKTPLPFTGTRYGQFALEAKQAQEEAKRANSLGGLFKNTLLGLPKALKDMLLPTRGYSDSELSQAKPTFKQTLLGVPKVAAEISSALGELLGSSGTSIAANFSQTKIGGKLADAGDKIRDFSVPKNAEEAKAMRIADVASFIPIGSVNATTRVVVSQIAKEKSPIVIKNLLKKIGDYSDDIIEALVRADTVDEVTSVLRSNRTIRQVEFSETANLLPAKEAVAKGLTEDEYVDRAVNDLFNQLDVIEKRQRELHGIDLLDESKARRIKISTQLDNLAKQTTRLNRDLSESQLRTEYQTAKGLSKPSSDFIGEPKKSGKQLAKEEVDNMFAERERKVAREYVERKTTNRAEYDPGYFARKETLEISQAKTELDIAKEALFNNPAKALSRYANKNGELPEVIGGKGGIFQKTGDDIADQLGFADSETARRSYERYLKQKQHVSTLENNLKTTRQIEKQTKPPQISQQSSQTIPNSKALVGRTMSEGEAKSIEIQAKQAIDIMDGAKIPDGVSLHKIISDTVTPVTKKVNFIDTFLRTPDRVMNKIGFGKEAVELRRAMDSYWKELPKNIAKHTEWAKRVPKESNERIFKYLDGQAIDLRPDEKQVALEVRVYLAQWADRLGLAKDQRVSEYITRLFDEELLAKEFPEELAKLIADKVPGSVYNPFMLRRLGAKGYKQDTWAALDAYVKRATRKVHMDPVLEKIQTKSGQSLEMANIEKTQFKFIQRYIENINMRPTDLEESFDNAIKSSFVGYKFGQRPVASVTQFLRRVSFRGSIGLNPTSALRNLSQGVNTYAVLGEKYTTIGYASLFKKGAKEELELEGILNAGFIQDRVISSTQKTIEVMDKGLFAMFQTAEFINRGAAYFGAKSKALSEGKTMGEAIEYAKGIVRKTQFAFDSVDTPVGMSSNIAKTAMQFQTFTMKQMEFLGGMAKDSVTGKEKAKNVIGLLRYATAGLVFVYTVGQVFNMKEKELIPVYRLGVPAALKPIVEAGKAALDLPDKYGNQRSLKEKIVDVAKSAIGYIPGGSQIKKTVEGVAANNSGGSFDKGGNLQFKVGETLPQKIQAGIFGKYAAPQAEKYFNRAEEAKKLDAEAERTYYELLALPESEGDQRFTQLEKDNPKLAGKIKVIGRDLNLGITEKDRELRAFGVTNGDRAQRVLDYILELPSEADQDKLYDELVRKRIITSVVAKQIQELMQSR